MADRLQMHDLEKPYPYARQEINSILLHGPPGTGKSRAIQALTWHAYQHDLLNYMATTAFIWKAALNISIIQLPAAK